MILKLTSFIVCVSTIEKMQIISSCHMMTRALIGDKGWESHMLYSY